MNLRQLLADLGDTPDAVADRLRALGIKGKQVSGDCCPIARYIVQCGFAWASVGHLSVLVNNPAREFTQHMEPCPKPVRRFIQWFDGGVYLDLVEQPTQAATCVRCGQPCQWEKADAITTAGWAHVGPMDAWMTPVGPHLAQVTNAARNVRNEALNPEQTA